MGEIKEDLSSIGLPVYQRAIQGSFWVFGIRFLTNLFNLLRIVILARLLTPKDFGLFGITLLAVQLFEMVSQTGMDQALIHKKEDTASYLNTAWVIQVFRGLVLAVIMFILAPYLAAFFEEPLAASLLRLVGACMLLRGLNNIGVVYFQKELEFNKQFVYQISGTLMDFIVSVAAAVTLRNAWALVFGFLAGNFTRLVMSYIVHTYRPRAHIDWKKARDLFTYGKWVFSSNLLGYLVLSLDDVVVGRVLSAAVLGLYQMAFRLANFATTEVTNVISQVTFPAYSKIRDDKTRLRDGVMRTMSMVSIITIPLSIGLFILAPEIVKVVLGQKWVSIVPVFQILCIIAILRSVTSNFGPVFLSTGRPDILTKVSIMNLSLLGITIYPLIVKFGMLGAVYSRLFTFITQFYIWPKVMKILDTNFKPFLRVLIPPIACSILMVLAVMGLKLALIGESVLELLLLIGVGLFVYLVSLLIIDIKLNLGIREEVKFIINTLR